MEDELDTIECAIRRVLDQELSSSSENAGRKIELLQRLIEEVHAAKGSTKEPSSDSPANVAVKAAAAAANAAQAAANSAANNSRMIQLLLETVRTSRMENNTEIRRIDEDEDEDDDGVERSLASDKKLSRIIKNLQRQNIITHFILGFMVVTTAIWRVKEITWINRVRKMLSNPFDAVGEIFGGDHHQQEQQHRQRKHKEEVDKPMLPLPHLELPQIFHKTETTEEKTSSSTSTSS